MLGFAWLTLRQAQEALKNGRLEEAHRLLNQAGAQGHKRSWELLQQLASGFAERGERHLRQENVESAWGDLLRAEELALGDATAARLRQALERLGLVQARALLQAGEPGRATEALAFLHQRSVQHPDLKALDEAAQKWLLARELAGRGEFTLALAAVDRVARFLSAPNALLVQFRSDLEKHKEKFAGLLIQLHEAAERGRWREVIELSAVILAAAPEHREARKARALAWKAIEPVTVAEHDAQPVAVAVPADEPPHRFLLWIDGVGGYLVCLGSRITLGQATPDAFVDVPLFADVSRLHATLTRDAEGYLLESVRAIQVNGQPAERTLLRPSDRITLGSSCQFQFRQPSPISASARLDLVSGHRLPLAVDGVLLMAETLLLGPSTQMHVTMPDLKQPVVLFRQKDALGVRCSGMFRVDGQKCEGRSLLGARAQVVGEDFAFAIEPMGR
jgi:tetratricopeptide (TPR) repeat protein